MHKFRALGIAGLMMSLPFGILAGCDSEVAVDGGNDDAGIVDAGDHDAGIVDDAGVIADAGPDAGPLDAGPQDAGPVVSIDFISVPTPVAISANGATALLQNFGDVVDVYLYDTASKVLTHKTTTGDDPAVAGQEAVYGLSGDGTQIIGSHGVPAQASVWSDAQGWRSLGSGPFDAGCDPAVSIGWGLSFDGTVAVGLDWDGCQANAFRWTDAGGLQVMGVIDGGVGGSGRASVVSSDGKVVAGFAPTSILDRTPALWQLDGTGVMLDPDQAAPGEVLAISADGAMVAGTLNLEGFYWTQADGLVNIGKLPNAFPTDTTFLNAIAANGQLIFGGCGDPFGGIVQAVIWTKAGGLVTLQDIAVAQGVAIPDGYILGTIMGASADGTTLLGWGLDARGATTSFVLRMPVSAYGITP